MSNDTRPGIPIVAAYKGANAGNVLSAVGAGAALAGAAAYLVTSYDKA